MLLSNSLAMAFMGLSSTVAGSGITGHDFSFSVSYITYLDNNGPKFSTSDPPKDPITAEDALLEQPILILAKPDSSAKYISFLQITEVPSGASNTTPTENLFPWIKANQSAAPDGSLSADLMYPDSTKLLTNELHTATLQVWEQTDAVLEYLQSHSSSSGSNTVESAMGRLFTNDTSNGVELPSLDFSRASISIQIRNATGLCRNDVNSAGQPVSVATAVTSACGAAKTTTAVTSTTIAPTTTTASAASGSGSGSGGGSSTSPTATPSATPSGAASLPVVARAGWASIPVFASFLFL
ncbi:hypothetical protein F5Y16DRAFT_365859 [Xylariaceae sp. FL0255]|nr:hypothetical protein F5Y16DRAFT_365859 [Xylariaceae sp. FL0255]